MTKSRLIIGNKNYSSWSLRPWLLMRVKGIVFDEQRITLHTDAGNQAIREFSPSGKVPVYLHGDMTLWDSLAICEYINDLYPEKQCWPEEIQQRAVARSISSEMHSSFQTIRNTLYMNCRKKMVYRDISPKLQTELDRVRQIWRQCREKKPAGPFLFGEFSIADAMYAPMVLRFNSYGIEVDNPEHEYIQNMLSLEVLQEWIQAGVAETEILPGHEVQ